jgi:hypothetical protein
MVSMSRTPGSSLDVSVSAQRRERRRSLVEQLVLCAVLGEEPFKVASHEHRPQLVLVGNVELIAAMIIPARISGVCPPTSRCAG